MWYKNPSLLIGHSPSWNLIVHRGIQNENCWNYGSLLEWWLYYWNGDYTIEKVAHYWNGGYTIGMVAILLKRWLTIGMVAILLELWLYY